MKQELVRTKSKISSLRREMSSIQQLHLAQQHGQAQFLTPTMNSNRTEIQRQNHLSPNQTYLQPVIFTYTKESLDQTNFHSHHHHRQSLSTSSNDESLSPPIRMTNPTCSVQSTQTSSRSPPSTINQNPNSPSMTTTTLINPSNDSQRTRRSLNVMPSSSHCDPSSSHSDEQLRLYLTETLQREKDSAV